MKEFRLSGAGFVLAFGFVSQPLWAHIPTYFNHSESASYTDSYRNIQRNGDDLEAVLLEHMGKAKKRLWVAVQELRIPSISKLLIKKQAEGVDVRLVLENSYNFSLEGLTFDQAETGKGYSGTRVLDYFFFVDENGDHTLSTSELEDHDAIYMLRKHEVPTIDDTADGTKGSGLMHHKFVVIDDREVVVTSANFTLSDIHGDFKRPETRGNANALMVFESAEMNKFFAEEYGYMWGTGPALKKASRFGAQKPYRAPRDFTLADGEKVTVQFSATKAHGAVKSTIDLIASTLESAQQSINFALFAFSDQTISNAIHTAHDQNHADVHGLVEPSFAYRYYSELLDMWGIEIKGYKCKIEQGNAPWKDPIDTVGVPALPVGDFLHHKFATVDHKKVIFGSHNWSESAAFINDETLVVVESAEVAAQFDTEMARLERGAKMGAPAWLVEAAAKGTCDSGAGGGETEALRTAD